MSIGPAISDVIIAIATMATEDPGIDNAVRQSDAGQNNAGRAARIEPEPDRPGLPIQRHAGRFAPASTAPILVTHATTRIIATSRASKLVTKFVVMPIEMK